MHTSETKLVDVATAVVKALASDDPIRLQSAGLEVQKAADAGVIGLPDANGLAIALENVLESLATIEQGRFVLSMQSGAFEAEINAGTMTNVLALYGDRIAETARIVRGLLDSDRR